MALRSPNRDSPRAIEDWITIHGEGMYLDGRRSGPRDFNPREPDLWEMRAFSLSNLVRGSVRRVSSSRPGFIAAPLASLKSDRDRSFPLAYVEVPLARGLGGMLLRNNEADPEFPTVMPDFERDIHTNEDFLRQVAGLAVFDCANSALPQLREADVQIVEEWNSFALRVSNVRLGEFTYLV